MCLRDHGIVDNNGVVGRVRRAHGLSNDDGGVGRGRGVDDLSKGLETTAEAARIQGQQKRLRSRDDRPGELATTTEALLEKDERGESTTKTEVLAEESDETTHLIERL